MNIAGQTNRAHASLPKTHRTTNEMRSIQVLVLSLCFTLVLSAQSKMTNEDVIRMTQQGITPAVVTQAIQSSRAVDFHVTPADQPGLASAGVPRPVIIAMVERVMRDAARSSSYVAEVPTVAPTMAAPAARPQTEPRPHVVKEFPALRAGQPEVAGGLTIAHGAGLTKAGVAVDGGISIHPRFTAIGEYNYTPLASGSV